MILLCLYLHILCSGTLTGPARIVDGDTLAIGAQPVRLAGIDAEELSEPNGPAAREQLRRLVDNKIVTCQWRGMSYRRVVGTCSTEAGELNAMMVATGFALDCYHYSKGLYATLEPSGARQHLISKGYCK